MGYYSKSRQDGSKQHVNAVSTGIMDRNNRNFTRKQCDKNAENINVIYAGMDTLYENVDTLYEMVTHLALLSTAKSSANESMNSCAHTFEKEKKEKLKDKKIVEEWKEEKEALLDALGGQRTENEKLNEEICELNMKLLDMKDERDTFAQNLEQFVTEKEEAAIQQKQESFLCSSSINGNLGSVLNGFGCLIWYWMMMASLVYLQHQELPSNIDGLPTNMNERVRPLEKKRYQVSSGKANGYQKEERWKKTVAT